MFELLQVDNWWSDKILGVFDLSDFLIIRKQILFRNHFCLSMILDRAYSNNSLRGPTHGVFETIRKLQASLGRALTFGGEKGLIECVVIDPYGNWCTGLFFGLNSDESNPVAVEPKVVIQGIEKIAYHLPDLKLLTLVKELKLSGK